MRNTVMAALAAMAVLLAAPASAQGGVHQHDGFFLRLEPGLGYLHSSASQGPDDLSIHGGAGDFSLAIGGAVKENLVLAGHLYLTAVSNPTIELNGLKSSSSNTNSSLVGIGPQLTYYFMPYNLYLSGTVALTRLTTEHDGVEADTNVGAGLRLSGGKEWWVSNNWGLGVGLHLGLSTNKDKGADPARFGTWTSGISFSATYN